MVGRVVKLSAVLAVSSVLLTGCLQPQKYEPFDEEEVVLLQLEPMAEGEEIAVVDTTKGEFRMRFFPSEAPKAVENFVTLAREGFYDNKSIFNVQQVKENDGEVRSYAFLAGSCDDTGETGTSIFDEKPFKTEIGYNLWHFPGAVSAYHEKRGKADSRFFIVGSLKVQEDILRSMEKSYYPQKVVDQFQELGGVPGYSLYYTIFAQVYEGMDIVSLILKTPVNERGIPEEDVLINKITVSTFEND